MDLRQARRRNAGILCCLGAGHRRRLPRGRANRTVTSAASAARSYRHSCALLTDLRERPPVAFQHRLLSRVPLPPPDDDVHILRIKFNAEADAPGLLGCDESCSRTEEAVINC